MADFNYKDIGIIDYQKCWDYQQQLLEEIQNEKSIKKQASSTNYFLLVEHPHVYTLGKSGNQNNLLVHDVFLKEIKASYIKINRGGDITYHGPGQLVGYPVLDLEYYRLSVREYIEKMEKAIIEVVAGYGISCSLKKGAVGIWIDADNTKARKIAAIGVRVSRYVTMHGFALNVNTDMRYFNYINPCGITAYGVTSLEKELGHKVDMNEVKQLVKEHFNVIY